MMRSNALPLLNLICSRHLSEPGSTVFRKLQDGFERDETTSQRPSDKGVCATALTGRSGRLFGIRKIDASGVFAPSPKAASNQQPNGPTETIQEVQVHGRGSSSSRRAAVYTAGLPGERWGRQQTSAAAVWCLLYVAASADPAKCLSLITRTDCLFRRRPDSLAACVCRVELFFFCGRPVQNYLSLLSIREGR